MSVVQAGYVILQHIIVFYTTAVLRYPHVPLGPDVPPWSQIASRGRSRRLLRGFWWIFSYLLRMVEDNKKLVKEWFPFGCDDIVLDDQSLKRYVEKIRPELASRQS